MSGFNNQAYADLVQDLINDAFYLDKRSRRGTLSTIRQYTEVIIRKLLNLSHDEFVTLGKRDLVENLRIQSNNNCLLMDSLETIRIIGNKCTHTQDLTEITENDIKESIDCLFNLYSYMFIGYFEQFRFGTNSKIMRTFSILPPIIRFKTLTFLYNKDPQNISIIDRLSLATLKAFDKNEALQWLDDRYEIFTEFSIHTNDVIEDMISKLGFEEAQIIIRNSPNIYDYCYSKIVEVANTISNSGLLYNDFESAMSLYQSNGILEGTSTEIKSFNSLMEFVYLGRKPKINPRLSDLGTYTSSLFWAN